MKNTVYTVLMICFCFSLVISTITSCSIFRKDKEEIQKIASDVYEEAIKDIPEEKESDVPSNAKNQKEEKKSA